MSGPRIHLWFLKEFGRFRPPQHQHLPGLQRFVLPGCSRRTLRHKQNDRQQQRGIAVFNASAQGAGWSRYAVIMELFARESAAMHGLTYLLSMPLWVRAFWTLVLLTAAAGTALMYVQLSVRHNAQHLKTVVKTSQFPIYNIAFPAIAVCPWHHVNWLRRHMAEERFLPPNASAPMRSAFQQLLISLELVDFFDFEHFSHAVARREQLLLLQDINLAELSRLLAFRCDELITDCVFDETPHDCCKLFVSEATEKGTCMVFNSLVSEESRRKQLTDTFYPWKLSKAGENSGLRFTVRYNRSFYRSDTTRRFAMDLMIKETEQWSESITNPLYANTMNYIAIMPKFTETAKNTRSVAPSQRNCLFSDENWKSFTGISVLPYNRQNCYANCMQRYLEAVCNCTMPIYFPTNDFNLRECRAPDLICLFENRDIFSFIKVPNQDEYIRDTRRGITCDCLDNCYSLVYLISLNTVMLRPPRGVNGSGSYIKADIHYSQRVMTKYETKLEYTSIDLMASFGGVFALFLGASMLSAAELLALAVRITYALFLDMRTILRRVRTAFRCRSQNKVSVLNR